MAHETGWEHKETLQAMGMFISMAVVGVSWVNAYAQTRQIVNTKYMQFYVSIIPQYMFLKNNFKHKHINRLKQKMKKIYFIWTLIKIKLE